jgi:trans-aconitate methyltransferase
MQEIKNHWESVYVNKQPHEVSWTQEVPETSLAFIKGFNLPKDAAIIDIGGGDSKLVDYLLDDGYTNVSVLDIAEAALEKAQKRLGDRAGAVKWIVSDVTTFRPEIMYDCWHDRAAFHFLTEPGQVDQYVQVARKHVKGFMAIGTFSHDGPKKCSGLEIKQYNEQEMQTALQEGFTRLQCITEDHVTPFNTRQNFLFCSFKAKGH